MHTNTMHTVRLLLLLLLQWSTATPSPPDLNNPQTYQTSSTVNTPMAVAISNNGKHVYLTIRSLNQVIQFDRDSNRKRSLTNPVYYTDQLNAVNSVALDGEGTYIYFTSSDPFITFYQRDGHTGQLSNQQSVALQLSNHQPFSGTSLLVGPNDAFVYVASHESHVLQVFRREMNGGLALVQSVSIFYPIDLAVSLDGTSIYVACSGIASNAAAGTLKSFQRNTTNGTLFDRFQWDVGKNTNLKGVKSVAVSPDGKSVYLAAREDHVIYVYDRTIDGNNVPRLARGSIQSSLPAYSVNQVVVGHSGDNIFATLDSTVGSSHDSTLVRWDRVVSASGTSQVSVSNRFDTSFPRHSIAQSICIPKDETNVYVAASVSTGYTHYRSDVFAWNQRTCVESDGALANHGACVCGQANDTQSVPLTCNAQSGFHCFGPLNFCSPTTCLLGEYADAATSSCRPCGLGKYSDVSGITSEQACKDCERGSYSMDLGLTSGDACTVCEGGSYANATGSIHCTLCSRGRFNGDMGQYRVAAKHVACDQCALGLSSGEGETFCHSGAPPGYFSTSTYNYTKCRAGFSCMGNEKELPCATGRYAKDIGSIECFLCAPGKYADQTQSVLCKSCPGNRVVVQRFRCWWACGGVSVVVFGFLGFFLIGVFAFLPVLFFFSLFQMDGCKQRKNQKTAMFHHRVPLPWVVRLPCPSPKVGTRLRAVRRGFAKTRGLAQPVQLVAKKTTRIYLVKIVQWAKQVLRAVLLASIAKKENLPVHGVARARIAPVGITNPTTTCPVRLV